jgi:hypothetical protein
MNRELFRVIQIHRLVGRLWPREGAWIVNIFVRRRAVATRAPTPKPPSMGHGSIAALCLTRKAKADELSSKFPADGDLHENNLLLKKRTK